MMESLILIITKKTNLPKTDLEKEPAERPYIFYQRLANKYLQKNLRVRPDLE